MEYIKTSAQEVLEDMVSRIKTLKLKPGDKISENEMAVHYNVSRSTIRTVFSKLEQIQLLYRYPQVGTVVATFDLKLVKKILYLRCLLEIDALERIIMNKKTMPVVSALEENMAEQNRLKDATDYDGELKGIDERFHGIILEAASLDGVLEVLTFGSIHVERWRNFEVMVRNKIPLMISQHQSIVRALKMEDLDACKINMREHLLSVQDDVFISNMKDSYPGFFSL